MRCTSCSQHVRPVVAFDIDGTLGDYHGHFTKFCGVYWDREYGDHPYTGLVEFEDWLGITKQQYREAKLAYRQGGMKRSLPIYPETRTVVQDCREAGAEVWIATTRPWQRLDNIDPDTRFWLARHNIHVDGMLYGDDKYGQLCQAVDRERIVAVVEDLPSQVNIARGLGLPVILRENHHNFSVSGNYQPKGSLAVCGEWAAARAIHWNMDHPTGR